MSIKKPHRGTYRLLERSPTSDVDSFSTSHGVGSVWFGGSRSVFSRATFYLRSRERVQDRNVTGRSGNLTVSDRSSLDRFLFTDVVRRDCYLPSRFFLSKPILSVI